jgi:serine/threonine protein kinase
MPLLSADNGDSSRSRSRQRARTEIGEHRSMWDRLNFQKIGHWLKKDENTPPPSPTKAPRMSESANKEPKENKDTKEITRPHSSAGLLGRRGSRKVIPGLPRPLTFKRMQSEKRDKLLEVPETEQRRAVSEDRKSSVPSKRNPSPPPMSVPSMSAPDVLTPHESQSEKEKESLPEKESFSNESFLNEPFPNIERTIGGGPDSNIPAGARQVDYGIEESEDYMSAGDLSTVEMPPPPPPPLPPVEVADAFSERGSHRSASDMDDIRLQEELEAKWILNLSMHFRDLSDREKFFVTFAEEPTRWRRVTVSCDYRHLEPESLEADLKTMHYQRDKSARIYEAIRDSLAAIQFYDTVTNLKLETADGRLHVHVTEDVNEIIPYPATSAIDHLNCKRFRENAVSFDSHISGFVYKVSVNNRTYIKKEIPGPDAVEEFLYEINALVSLQESKSVIRFEGVIVDEQNELIKGLLISYAEQGTLVDMIYDFKPTDQLYWERRERWARQIVEGLSEIHEAGFVQGDFTLSNIVIDHDDNAKIIDINRRGCPVGWEPPELARLIESGQRITIYIGVKSDLFQLGMVLWALAEQQDEPERQQRPLTRTLDRHNTDVPVYFRDIIRALLSDSPRARPSAASLLKRFPDDILDRDFKPKAAIRSSVSTHRSDKEYIDPRTAVDLEDISKHRRHSRQQSSFEEIHIPRTEYPASSGSYIIPNHRSDRGRSPGPLSISDRNRRSECSPYPGHRSVMSLDDSELENELASLPASRETRWEQIYVDGDTKLVQRGCADLDVHDFVSQDPKDICITSPPSEMENSFLGSRPADDTPLNMSRGGGLHPHSMQSSLQGSSDQDHREVGNKASFSTRVHELAQTQPDQAVSDSDATPDYYEGRQFHIPASATLANLEFDVIMDSSASNTSPPSRVSTGFSVFDRPEPSRRVGTGFPIAQGYRMPMHQDSGFGEPERISSESERIRHSLDESIKDLNFTNEDEARIDERLWDEKGAPRFGEGVRGAELEIRPEPIPIFTIPASPRKEDKQKQAPASMPPPPIPSVGPANVLSVEDVQDKALEEKNSNTTIRPSSSRTPPAGPKAVDSMDVVSRDSKRKINKSHTGGSSSKDKLRDKPTHDPFYDDYLSPAEDDDEDDGKRATSDLSDYLTHSIFFDQTVDYMREHEKQKQTQKTTDHGPRGPKV